MARFQTVSDEDITRILSDEDSANTKKSTEILFNVLCTAWKKTSFCYTEKIQRLKRGNDFDVMENPEFTKSNDIFSAQCVVLEKKGLADVQHYPPLSEEDVKKLYDSDVFNLNHLVSL